MVRTSSITAVSETLPLSQRRLPFAMMSGPTAVLGPAMPVVLLLRAAAISRRGSTQAEIGMTIPMHVGRGAC